jgi:hypothetical protein
MRRPLTFIGLVACVILFVTWAFGFFGPVVTHPGVARYEFGAPEGSELRVRGGRVEVVTQTSYWIAGPAKFYLEAATVITLFVVATSACVLVLRQRPSHA